MSVVFVSYRRLSALVPARAVYERLSRELGPGQIFIDLDDMEVGVDFVEQTNDQLRGCRVLLALIDTDWATATDGKGQRRLDRSNDFVRVEIATALRLGIRVVPVLIGDADMPDADALPEDLKPLARRHALALDFKRFDTEIARLVGVIRRILANPALDTIAAAETATGLTGSTENTPPLAEVADESQPVRPGPTPEPTAASPPSVGAAAPATSPARRMRWSLVAGGAVAIAVIAFMMLRPARLPDPIGPSNGRETTAVLQPPVASSGTQPFNSAPVAQASAPAPVARLSASAPAARPSAPAPTALKTPQVRQLYSAGQMFRDCPDCPEMVMIPQGSFLMGIPDTEQARHDEEAPQRRVNLPGFAMAKTEVTQAQWKALMGNNPSLFSQCGDACPVEQVSWHEAQLYVTRLSAKTGKQYALPSEAQWEYAARAGTTTPFHTGAEINTGQANFRSKATTKVASFDANAFGLHDMHGNVWEWVQDCYGEQTHSGGTPNGGSAYDGKPCESRMVRGGSYYDFEVSLRTFSRFRVYADNRKRDIGFRVCRVFPIEKPGTGAQAAEPAKR